MTRRLWPALLLLAVAVSVPPSSVSALGLKVAPLEYKTTLSKGERQTGVIDVSNPSGQAINVSTSVQAFKQIDNNGGLQFYDDKQVEAGIHPELTSFTLAPREALRMSFAVNGSNLPKGDIFAALFFTTEPIQPRNGVGQMVRVGTLLSIVNQTAGPRKAVVTSLDVPFFQLGSVTKGSYVIKNTGPEESGFYPTVTVSGWPGGAPHQQESSLVFGGHERSNDFSYVSGVGIHRIDVRFGDSVKHHWVVAVAPWMLIVGMLIAVVTISEYVLLRRRRASVRDK